MPVLVKIFNDMGGWEWGGGGGGGGGGCVPEGFCGGHEIFGHILMGHEIFFKIFDGPQTIFLCSIFVILFFKLRG